MRDMLLRDPGPGDEIGHGILRCSFESLRRGAARRLYRSRRPRRCVPTGDNVTNLATFDL
jgi:hypothetical protein